jgi:hypothetical protein
MTPLRIMLAEATARVGYSLAAVSVERGRLQMEAGRKVSRPVLWRVKTATALLALPNRIDR